MHSNSRSDSNTPPTPPSNPPESPPVVVIPAQGFTNMFEAARFYRDQFGARPHPLCGPNDKNVTKRERGKKPLWRNCRTLTTEDVVDDALRAAFQVGSPNNLGITLQNFHVVVDVDSKTDEGESARRWVLEQPHLAGYPREQTAHGAHLHFFCPDLPPIMKAGKPHGSPLVNTVVEGVGVELFSRGLSIVVAPSVHQTDRPYSWAVTGQIPVVTWPQLKSWFGFKLPDEKAAEEKAKRGGKKVEVWWRRYCGDLKTLNLTALCDELAILGDVLSVDDGKRAARCPWRHEHSDASEPWRSGDSDTVIFIHNPTKNYPGFKCMHAHCADRGLREMLNWAEQTKPGIVDRHCTATRTWQKGKTGPDKRPQVPAPSPGHPISEFATEVGKILADTGHWFRHGTHVVMVRYEPTGWGVSSLILHPMQATEVCSAIEDHVEVGGLTQPDDAGASEFIPNSIIKPQAELLLAAAQFRDQLPEIQRVLDVPVPVLVDGKLELPAHGYDARFKTYLNLNAPKIQAMSVERAKQLIHEMYAEFCWADTQSVTHAIARIITPACRGIMGWDAKTPFFLYMANRERLGKDFAAGIPMLLFQGRAVEEAPIEPRNSSETRKRITAALLSGRRTMHFANCRGHLDDPALEEAITAKFLGDRILGRSESVHQANEVEYSMSANTGLTFKADLAQRTRTIRLFLSDENPNGRRFARPDLHAWVMQHRAEILSVIFALVQHWHKQGMPGGPTPFASFPEWSRVVGGVMAAAGLGDPCLPENNAAHVGGDEETENMKILFQMGHERWGVKRVELKSIVELLSGDDAPQLFSWLDLAERPGQTVLGKMLRRFVGRSLGAIVLRIHGGGLRRPKFSFERCEGGDEGGGRRVLAEVFGSPASNGDVGDIGNLYKPPAMGSSSSTNNPVPDHTSSPVNGVPQVANVANVAIPSSPVPIPITDRAALEGLAQAIAESTQPVALDIETYGGGQDALNPWRGNIRLLTLALPNTTPWVLDLKAIGYNLGPLGPALEAKQIIGHNLKFDALWLRHKCGLNLQHLACTMTASRLLTAGDKVKNDLGACLSRHLDIDIPKDQAKSNWGCTQLTPEQLRYAAQDVAHLHALHADLLRELESAGLTAVWQLESELIPVVVAMEHKGFLVDRAVLVRLQTEAQAVVEATTTKLRAEVGPDFNPGSVKQVKQALSARGFDMTSTDEETLTNVNDPLAGQLLQCRQAKKQLEQVETLLASIESDGRIHASFKPTGTDTGRFSCSGPNLQNVSRGQMRSAFVAAPGHRLVIADYSQIELRIAAAIADETAMLEAFRAREDLHRQTAALVLGKTLDSVTKDDRQLAKAVNFGLLYGQRATGLVAYAKSVYGVVLTEAQAQEIRVRFFDAYPALASWHAQARTLANQNVRETRTILGRRRLLPSGRENWWLRFAGLLNTPVQGGAADGMKRALVALAQKLPAGAVIVSTIHDEIIVEVPEAVVASGLKLVEQVMVDDMSRLYPTVPITAEVHVCRNWGDK